MSFLRHFLMGFVYAFKGLVSGFEERNMKIHITAVVIIVILSVFFRISSVEWIIVILLFGVVISAELFNTAIEEICDRLRDDLGLPYVAAGRARDIAAGAVLSVAVTAAIIAGIIFLPKVLAFLLSM